MNIRRLAVSEFKRFRSTLVLDDLQPGLNIIEGPNEAGKSTLALALRAAFLERFKTTTVGGFVPNGLAQGRPTVEVDFDFDGVPYRLQKSFVHRARCELSIGSRRLEGEQAEQALAELLGFEIPGKGQSKPNHAGVPGLLWVTQGTSGGLAEPASHAGLHLRDALTRLSGELAATDGDRIFARVDAERSVLLDARQGRPKGPYRQAVEALEQARADQAELQTRVAQWDADVDRLASLRAAHRRDSEQAPWQSLEQQVRMAQARMSELTAQRHTLQTRRARVAQLDATVARLSDQVARDAADDLALRTLQAECEQARQGVADLRARVDPAQRACRMQEEALAACAARLVDAREVQAREMVRQQADHLAARSRELQSRLAQAQAQQREWLALRQQTQAWTGSPKDVQALREGMAQAATWRARVGHTAPRLSYALVPGGAVQLDGQTVQGQGEHLLRSETRIVVPGVGELTITPGGGDLADAAARLDAVTRQNDILMKRLGVGSMQEAETRAQASDRAAQQADFAARALSALAPEGIDVLVQTAAEAEQAVAALHAQDGTRANVDQAGQVLLPDAAPVDPDALQREHDLLLGRVTAARDARRDALSACEQAEARLAWLNERRAAEQARQQDDAAIRERTQRQAELTAAQTEYQHAQQQMQQAEADLQAQQPELLEQDIMRWSRSAQIAREAHQTRALQVEQLQGRLEQAGAEGLGEALAASQAAFERWQRRCDELAQRAAALTLLHERLRGQRDAATQRLFAPLARRLTHYLTVLFPDAALTLGEDFTPATLGRAGALDAMANLSFGTQEQLGVLTRLAYADVLREAGRPTLLVLDDALVHTDERRRQLIKRALFDAASRHQILLLTCHGEGWRDMGVPLRTIM